MAAKKKSEQALNLDIIWAGINETIEALERGLYLRSNKQSHDLGGSWEQSVHLEGLRAARAEIERFDAKDDQSDTSESEPDA